MLNSEEKLSEIADFLNIKLNPEEHIKALDFRRSDGTQWFQNTSYDSDNNLIEGDGWKLSNKPICTYFDTAPVYRWKKTLTEKEIKSIELLCGKRMNKAVYKKLFTENIPTVDLFKNALATERKAARATTPAKCIAAVVRKVRSSKSKYV